MIDIKICPICSGTRFFPYLTCKDFTVTNQNFSVKQCAGCSLLVTSPRPDETNLAEYYASDRYVSHTEESNEIMDRLYRLVRKFTLRWKEKLITPTSTERSVLDYGCGTGDFLHHCKKNGWLVHGVEPTNKAYQIAQQKLGANDVTTNLTSEQRQFSAITLWHVLEHIPDLNHTLTTLKTHLSPQGKIYFAVPNTKAWESTLYNEYWAAYDVPRHLWHFNKGAFEKLLNNNGLRLVKVVPMKLDAFYISLLSEKYLNRGKNSIGGIINAVKNGLHSNQIGARTGEYSSLIYVAEHA